MKAIQVDRPNSAYSICFHINEYISWEKALIHTCCPSMRYGISVFEGIRLYKQNTSLGLKPFALEEHVNRLAQSLTLMKMPDPGVKSLYQVIEQLTQMNEINDDAYIRAAVNATSFGVISSPIETSITVTAFRMGRKVWLAEGRQMKVSISHWQKPSELSFPSSVKNISSYAASRLAILQAIEQGYDNTILINEEGFLCEAPTATLFIICDGRVITPPLSEGILPSITRRAILEICRILNIPAAEQHICPTDAYSADEAFLCGTAIEIAAIESFDKFILKKAEQAPVTKYITDAYFRLVRGESIL